MEESGEERAVDGWVSSSSYKTSHMAESADEAMSCDINDTRQTRNRRQRTLSIGRGKPKEKIRGALAVQPEE